MSSTSKAATASKEAAKSESSAVAELESESSPAVASPVTGDENQPATQKMPGMTESYLRWQLEKKSVHRPFDFDVYYPLLKDHTWASRIIPFSSNLAQACVNYYQARFSKRISRLRPEDVKLLRDLERSLDDAMSASSCTNFFIRMSNRSPKDGFPLEASKLSREFKSELSKITSNPLAMTTASAATSASAVPPSPESDDEDALLTEYSANDIMVAYSGDPHTNHRRFATEQYFVALCMF